ncbi:DegQ family serine endoprotease [Pseudokordiimonas caeni]|uniref:DegQ family serine endoprotease n=1 Tax=Pseudokordiimonas caeni TaxID=2997908 RepID=UPI0028119936|nr:DegQ family serine endoprotease [Pseudokordiimonas caeni]
MSTYENRNLTAKNGRRMTLRSALMAVAAVSTLAVGISRAEARGTPESFADLVDELSPAVVNISTVQTLRGPGRRALPQLPEGMPFGDLWEEFRDRMDEEEAEPQRAQSLGSGFIIDKAGYVVTNNHVIEDADEITVIIKDGEELPAKVVGRDSKTDLALLKIEDGNDLPFVRWGDSDKARIGDWVMAIGNPFGLGGSVTAGIISARNRPVGSAYIDFIQTDAPINRGNSGGPLFNMAGEVVGINSAIFSPSGGNVGIGFAIPSNDARRYIEELKEHGKIRRGWLGVTIEPVTEEIAKSLGLDIKEGAIVNRTFDDSPAKAAGIEAGDIILAWDGKAISDTRSLSQEVARTEVGKPVKVDIIRQGKRMSINVKTGELQDDVAENDNNGPDGPRGPNMSDRELVQGMELAPLNGDLRGRYRIADDVEGVAIVRVDRRSEAFQAGIRAGTVIMRVNQEPVTSITDVADKIDAAEAEGRESVLLLVHFRGNTVHIPLTLEAE